MCRHVGGSVAASYGMEGSKQADFGSERYKNRSVATFAGIRKRQTRTRRYTRKGMVPDVGSRKRCTSRGCTGVPTHGFRLSTSITARFCAKHVSNEMVDLTETVGRYRKRTKVPKKKPLPPSSPVGVGGGGVKRAWDDAGTPATSVRSSTVRWAERQVHVPRTHLDLQRWNPSRGSGRSEGRC
ncbi:unnamed protein product [Ectocarpus sp. 6 AP-2014]